MNDNLIFPRTLILTPNVFNQYTGGGVLLTNLFRGWPADKLATVHGDSLMEDSQVCKKFYRLTLKELKPAWPFWWFYRSREAGHWEPSGSHPMKDSRRVFQQHLYQLARSLTQRIVGRDLPWSILLSKELIDWIDEFKPEILYTLVGGPYMRAAIQISERWDIPLVTHMMDDWPGEAEAQTLLWPFFRNRALKDLREIFMKSAARMAICDPMSSAYEKRYKVPFISFQNAADLEARLKENKHDWSGRGTFKVLYIGSILPNAQLQSLVDVAGAVSHLKDDGLNIEMHIYSLWAEQYQSLLQTSSAVFLHGPLDEDSIFKTLTDADLLVIPVNFGPASVQYIRYSMPAKVPLYMVAGTPILVYGPAQVASVDYALREKWAHVVTQNDPTILRQAIRQLQSDAAYRERLGKKGIQIAQKNHDGLRIRAQFRSVLIDTMSSFHSHAARGTTHDARLG